MTPLNVSRTALHRVLVPVTALALVAAGCSGDSDEGTEGADAIPVFAAFEDCADVLSWTKAEMLKRVGPYGLEYYPWMYASGIAKEGDMAVGAPVAPTSDVPVAEDGSGSGTSVTNTQEIDVDEGDIVETDGRYVYSIVDNRLRSVDLDNGTLLSEIDLPRGDAQMILNGDRLVVANTVWDASASAIVTQYSVADGELTFERRDHLEGWLVTMRAVDGVVFMTMRSGLVERID
ncbi:MAG: beta-propeller domain-containing protein, partial [Actinomycetota bacterium]